MALSAGTRGVDDLSKRYLMIDTALETLEPRSQTAAALSPLRVHNGFELSGPAKSRPDYRAELAGSAPASG
jgi:hypothetical protein